MTYCPNCSFDLSTNLTATSCLNCGADFGPLSAWRPVDRVERATEPATERPGNPVYEVLLRLLVAELVVALGAVVIFFLVLSAGELAAFAKIFAISVLAGIAWALIPLRRYRDIWKFSETSVSSIALGLVIAGIVAVLGFGLMGGAISAIFFVATIGSK